MSNREKLLRVVEDVLERFAFMFVEKDDEKRLSGASADCLHAVITFKGKTMGGLSVTAPTALCREMAANVLGLDPVELGDGAEEDALQELANVICGSLIPELFGDHDAFDLTVPILYHVGTEKWNELAAEKDTVGLWIDDKPILFSLMTSEVAVR